MNRKALYPVLVFASALVVAALMVLARPKAAPEVREAPTPLVRVVEVVRGDVPMQVHTQGRVQPRAEIDLVAEVSGRVVEVSPSLAAGGFFAEGDVLARIDPHDYALAVDRARAEVARADVRVATERAEGEVAVREWSAIGDGGAVPALVARRPQQAEAVAALAAARAVLAQAEKDLERTAIRAPFAGRVRDEDVDVGEFVTRGARLGRIYSTDFAEIRLPLQDADLAFLDLPLVWRDGDERVGPPVDLHADFAGRRWHWKGRIVRTEGQVDPTTHVVHAVAVVEDPYGHGDDPGRPPLAAGLFVQATVEGRTARDVVAVPRAAMRGDSRVFVVDGEDLLRTRKVKVLRREAERVILAEGLRSGERVCISPLEVAVDGMKVRVAEPEPAGKQDSDADGEGVRSRAHGRGHGA